MYSHQTFLLITVGMSSLTSILPAIAPVLGLTTQALYERQRALIRLALLPAPEGRGKSGASASPDTVALLIVAAMATDNLSDTDDRVRKLAFAPFVVDRKKDRCPWTGATSFKDALAFILSPAAPASKPGRVVHNDVHVSRSEPGARIFFSWPKRAEGWSEFKGSGHDRDDRLQVSAHLPDGAIRKIRLLLSDGGLS